MCRSVKTSCHFIEEDKALKQKPLEAFQILIFQSSDVLLYTLEKILFHTRCKKEQEYLTNLRHAGHLIFSKIK